MAFALVLSVQLLFAQQTDPNATPAPEQPKVSYLAYFLSILAIVLGLVVMLRPGSRVDPDAK